MLYRALFSVIFLFALFGCTMDKGHPYLVPSLPPGELAEIVIENDDNLLEIMLGDPGSASIERIDGLYVGKESVLVTPGRHEVEIKISFSSRFWSDVGSIFADDDEEEDDYWYNDYGDNIGCKPYLYEDKVTINATSGRTYNISYEEVEVTSCNYELKYSIVERDRGKAPPD